MMTIHINADLRPVLGEQVGMLHWIMDPAVSGFIIGYDLSGNQVLICNFDSQKHPVESWTVDHARSVVTAAIGKEIPFDVLSYRPWILSRKVATKYHDGNVFLCGDAAHSFPPTGGLGLNCGLADVHNLAYKITANLHGWGGRAVLESYGDERRRIAELYSQQSVKNGKKIFGFLKTLGLAGIDDVERARMELVKRVNEPQMQSQIKEGVEEQREHFDNVSLNQCLLLQHGLLTSYDSSNFTSATSTTIHISHHMHHISPLSSYRVVAYRTLGLNLARICWAAN
jgi:hypothetical protein